MTTLPQQLEGALRVVHERCADLDVPKRTVVVCVLVPGGKEVRTFATMTRELLQMVVWLVEKQVSHAPMESTSIYWRPVFNLVEGHGIELLVVNARHVKALPGRKTDVKDAEWLADLLRYGLFRASFVPDHKQRELRELARYGKFLSRSITRGDSDPDGPRGRQHGVDVVVPSRQLLEHRLA